MKLPKSIVILGRKFSVKVVKHELTVDGKAASGVTDTVNRIIEIEHGLPLREQLGILSHEIGHATLSINGLSETLTDREVEIVCQTCRSVVEDFVKAFNKR